jgi:hypothetical protein
MKANAFGGIDMRYGRGNSPDFSDAQLAAKLARVRDKLNAPDLSPYEKARLDYEERILTFEYWGF